MSSEITVLHVDDEPGLTDVAASFLERRDERFVVEMATSADEGLDLLDARFDCVVSDYDMPGMDGLEFLDAVREEHPDLPFVLFTGKGSEAVASDAISAGVTDYLQKRSGTDQYTLLANRVSNAVQQHRTEGRLREERRRFRMLFERFPQPVAEFRFENGRTVVVRVNDPFEETFGFEADELVGDSLAAHIVPEEYRQESTALGERVAAGDRITSTEVTRRTADGEHREFLLDVAVYEDGSEGFVIYTDLAARTERERGAE